MASLTKWRMFSSSFIRPSTRVELLKRISSSKGIQYQPVLHPCRRYSDNTNDDSSQKVEKKGTEEEEGPVPDPYLPPWPNGINPHTGERGGPRGPEPTRYGDWERKGRVSDF